MNTYVEFIDAVKDGRVGDVTSFFQNEYIMRVKYGLTALHVACMCKNKNSGNIVRFLLSKGWNIDVASIYDQLNPIHYATFCRNISSMTALIDAGCALDCLNSKGHTPLDILGFHQGRRNYAACKSILELAMQIKTDLRTLEHNRLSMIDITTNKTLLEILLSYNKHNVIEAIKSKLVDKQEFKDLMKIDRHDHYTLQECLLYFSIRYNYQEEFVTLCSADIVNGDSLFMRPTVLETAVEYESLFCVERIITKLKHVDESWERAMEMAKKNELRYILSAITKRKTDLDNEIVVDQHFNFMKKVIPLIEEPLVTPLISKELITSSMHFDDMSLVKMMYDNASNDVQTSVLEIILMKAAILDDQALFKEMINKEMLANNPLLGEKSLLTYLIRHQKTEFCKMLLQSRNAGMLLKRKNGANKLPLHEVVANGYWDILLECIVETTCKNDEDNDGNTPLSLLLTKISETEEDALIFQLMSWATVFIGKPSDLYYANKHGKTVISYCTNSDLRTEIERLSLNAFELERPEE